ncbi:DUF4149 domain-containing protein [Polynucleobacter sp. MWH-UH25E]|uniref:DUF4149 domain-containing protein n=1 Tax=Polynucleobacter sp. MWH-UH25E TaxID=1855616 RepID=UPI001BFD918C|nr:DUF4149 domain-containing protein [Polynucleobacter sp. MWH-UH25E]QWD62954.1 hypothetical protein ICV39_04935 [Polynucleobacter sp. MWH-UH25E]
MRPIEMLCCGALINPDHSMVEDISNKHLRPIRFMSILAFALAGSTIALATCCLVTYLSIEDSQVAGMISHLVMQHLTYWYLGCSFVILSLSNILIRRGSYQLKSIRIPALVFIIVAAFSSFLLIPRMDYLRESALQDGMPVNVSPFANYFLILNGLLFLLLLIQLISSILVSWRLSELSGSRSTQIRT